MKLKVPPAITTALVAVIMWVITTYLFWNALIFSVPNWIPVIIATLSILLGVAGLVQFHSHQTSIDPHKPEKATSLVHSGIYRFSRNPMYLGLLLLLVAYGCYLGAGHSLLILPLFVWYMNEFQIKPEEEILLQKFGADYQTYKKNVRRWI